MRCSFPLSQVLLATTFMATVMCHHASAASHKVQARTVSRTPAATAPKRDNAVGANLSPEEISVKSHYVPRGAIASVTQKRMALEVPGSNPLKVLGEMPGVMFQSNDAQGVDNWSAQLFMHGFQQSEVGATLDGIPLGEFTYRNYNGLNPIQAISSENVARIDVSQSAGAESVASTSNLGGALQYRSSDPKDKRGGVISQSFGSYAAYHTFIRFDSGRLNKSGTKFFASYMRNDTAQWKGYGEQFVQQVNAKLVQPVGNDSEISAFFDWSDLHQNNYQSESPAVLAALGDRVTDYTNGGISGYEKATQVALGNYPAAYNGLTGKRDIAYYDGGTNQVDYLGGLKADLAITNHLRWTTTAYGHGEESQTTWTSPTSEYSNMVDPSGSPLAEVVKEPMIRRFGVMSAVHYDIAHNHLGAGVWYENNHYDSPMNAYAVPNIVNGVAQGQLPQTLGKWTDPFAQLFNQSYNTNTFTAFFQDTYSPIHNLSLHFGFKSVLSTTRVGNGFLNPNFYGAGAQIASGVGLTTSKPFLPHISVDWRFLPGHEFFIDISENVHTYAESGYHLSNSPFAVTQGAYNSSVAALHPETAWTYAAGYRYSSPLISASVYGYRTNFQNRLQQVTSGSIINPQSVVENVGGVTMNGVDVGLTVNPIRDLALTNSISYDHAVYDNNISSGGTAYNTKNVQIVNYPRFMYKGRLSYDWHNATAYIDGNYIGARNYSYTGDVKVPGYWMANLGIQYKMSNLGKYDKKLAVVKNLIFSLNVTNLTNTHYISTMGANGNPMSISSGALSYASLAPGAPRMFFGSIRGEF